MTSPAIAPSIRSPCAFELPHQAQKIELAPRLGDSPGGDSIDHDARELDAATGGRDAFELASMRAARRDAQDDPVVLGDHVLDRVTHVGKRAGEGPLRSLELCEVHARLAKMADVIRRD